MRVSRAGSSYCGPVTGQPENGQSAMSEIELGAVGEPALSCGQNRLPDEAVRTSRGT